MIQAAINLVDLEQVIKGAEEVGRNNREDYLESEIKEGKVKKGGYFKIVVPEESVGQDYLLEIVEQ